MIKAVIIDDQEISRIFLHNAIKEYCEGIEVVAMADDVVHAISVIEQHKPDVIFLDIELGNGTGFEILEQVNCDKFDVIFTTGYDHYAIKAIKANALDYLQKPVDPDELKLAVLKMKKSYEERSKNKSTEDSQAKVAVPLPGGVEYLNTDQIKRCESDHYYTRIFLTNDRKYIVSRTLKEFEDLLSPHGFVRVHQSHLINLKFLDKFVRGSNNYVILSDQTQIPVSRRKKEVLIDRLSL